MIQLQTMYLQKKNVDALFLEYDDERSGGFAPLKKVSEDKKVVLGLITTKKPDLEDKEKSDQQNQTGRKNTFLWKDYA